MHTIKIIKKPKFGYLPEICNDPILSFLTGFLLTDIRGKDLFYKNWINDTTSQEFIGEDTYLEKKGDNILLGDLLVEDHEFFEIMISREEFIKIVENWERLWLSGAKEITITRIGSQFTIKG